jgi:hypothetical protein
LVGLLWLPEMTEKPSLPTLTHCAMVSFHSLLFTMYRPPSTLASPNWLQIVVAACAMGACAIAPPIANATTAAQVRRRGRVLSARTVFLSGARCASSTPYPNRASARAPDEPRATGNRYRS